MSFIIKKQAKKDFDKAPIAIKNAFIDWIAFMKKSKDDYEMRFKRFNDEALKGKLKGLRSIRLNKQWRVIFEENSQTIITIERITPMNIDIDLHDDDDDKYPDSMTIEEFYKERGIAYPFTNQDLSVIGQLTRTRQALGMTMKALAEVIGVPTQRINDFEKKRRKPPISVLVKWVDALDYDVAPFVFDYMMEELEEAGLDPKEFVASFQDWGKTPPRKKA